MKSSVDTRELDKALAAINFKGGDLLNVEGAGAAVLVNGMRMRVPVKLAATKNSIMSHIDENTDTRIVDEVGPETDYAPYLEYGTGEFAEGGNGRKGGWRYKDEEGNWHFTFGMKAQPFVRPTAIEDLDSVIKAIGTTFGRLVVDLWPK